MAETMEMRVMELAAAEYTDAQIAAELNYSVGNVHRIIGKLLKKYGVKSRVGLARKFAEEGEGAVKSGKFTTCAEGKDLVL
ncbi:MAG: LuxR C-terminal-related transcriptional regulator [Candidatus Gastranaerophilaceae bacterium]